MEELIAIGKITSTHGLKGFLKVIPLTESLDRFKDIKNLLAVSDNGKQIPLEIAHLDFQPHKNMVHIQFVGYEHVDKAASLANYYLKISKDEVPQLPEGSYYHYEIVGLKVFLLNGKYLGKVKSILETGANDVYLLEDTDSKNPVLIPALKSVVKSIDLQGKKMLIDPPAGLLENDDEGDPS